jgi:ribosomal protein L28
MSKQCAICQKGSVMVQRLKKLRGKYNPTGKKRKYPNLQWVTIPLDAKSPKNAVPFRGKRVLACAKCIKALGKSK